MSIDTVNDLPPRAQFTASAAQTVFDYPFPIFADADLVVEVDGVVKSLDTHYTVAGEGNDNGGTVTFITPMVGGEIVVIYRDIAIARSTDFQQNGPFNSASFNDELDKLTLIAQQLEAQIKRCLRVKMSATATDAQMEMSPISSWLGKYVFINASGYPEPATAVSGTVLSLSAINDLINAQSSVESGLGYVPSDKNYANEKLGSVFVERYGAMGDDSNDDYTAINKALQVMATAGGGTVYLRAGKIYRIGTSLVIPEKVRLAGTGVHGQPNEMSAIIKPTSAVVIGINNSGVNTRGIAIDSLTVDMQLMTDAASVGVRFSGVHQFEIKKLGVVGLPNATAIGLHLRGDVASTFGTIYGRVADLNISTDNLDRGVGVVCERVGAEVCNAVLFENCRVSHMTTPWKFIQTGSGITCMNCHAESSAGNGIEVTNTTAGSFVLWMGGEVNSNAGWGATGTGGRIVFMSTVMGTNVSGDVDTATLSVGARMIVATNGPAIEWEGVDIRAGKSFSGGTANQTVIASDTITAAGLKKRLTAAGPITMSSNPQIADGNSNQLLILVGTSDTNTIKLVNGNGLRLKENMVLGDEDALYLMYDSGGSNDWVEVGRSKKTQVVTFTNADATPSVADGNVFKTNGTTAITMFDDGEVGKTIKIRAGANITITNGANLKLAGAANFAMTADDTLTLTMYDSGVWTEDGRSVN